MSRSTTWRESALPARLVLHDVEVEGRRCDVRLLDGRIAAVAPSLRPVRGEEAVDGGGGAVLPGLHDHHIHLRALAAMARSERCGPPDVRDAEELTALLRRAPARAGGWLRGVGYHESVAGELDRYRLDAARSDVPVRVQHASGTRWTLNSAGVARLDLDSADHPGIERDGRGLPTGVLSRADEWLRERLPAAQTDLAEVSRDLATMGVVGVTDATVTNSDTDVTELLAARRSGALLQELLVLGRPDLRLVPGVGAVKVVLDEHALPEIDALVEVVRAAHDGRRPVAIHAVTLATLVLALTALRSAGAVRGDRIEHASVCPPELADELVHLGVTVVTQPVLIAERGQRYLRDVDPVDQPWLYPCGLLHDRHAPLAASSDAPYGHPDPWRGIAAAVQRRTDHGVVLGAQHRLLPAQALALYLGSLRDPGGPPRRVATGEPGNVCLLDAPLDAALAAPDRDRVRLVTVGGRVLQRDA
jgi:predicted amidohydrolase YtcJ